MSRLWRGGHGLRAWTWLVLVAVFLGGIGAVFGLRLRAIAITAQEVRTLRATETLLRTEIEEMRREVKRAEDAKVIEQKAREILHWAYPDEELVILIHRR